MNVVPKKSLGQNFLLNKNIIKKIVEFGKINNESIVIEIGPGTGNLTEEILKYNPKKFIAIEKDENLFIKLKQKYNKNIELINEDVLKINWEKLLVSNCLVFGNLPYNISSKILVEWIRLNNLDQLFKKFILMFQKEVADRIVASTDSNKYGRLSILTAWKMNSKKIMDIEPENFFPKPKVKSSVIYLEPKKSIFDLNDSKSLEKITNVFFQNRRKMIKKPLNILFNNSTTITKRLSLKGNLRPQNLSPQLYLKISKVFEDEL